MIDHEENDACLLDRSRRKIFLLEKNDIKKLVHSSKLLNKK